MAPIAGRFTPVSDGASVLSAPAAAPPAAEPAAAEPAASPAEPVSSPPAASSSAPAAAAAASDGAGSSTPAAAPAAAPVAEPPKTDPPKPEAKGDDKKPGDLDSWRFAALSKKERAIREEAEKVKAEKAQIEKDRAELAAERSKREERAQRYRLNPLAALEDAGLSYEEVTQFVLNNGNATPDQKIKALAEQVQQTNARLEAERKERAEALAAQQKAMEEREAQTNAARAEQAKASYLEELQGVVTADPDTYEMIGRAGEEAASRMWKVAEAIFAETGRAPSNKAVLDKVEEELFAEAAAFAKGSKKLSKLFAPPPPPPPAPAPEPVPVPPKTLSNRMTPAPAPRAAEGRRESRAERDARVLAEVQATLRGQR